MKYLKVWVSFRESLKEYSDAEKGRLFDAMLAYADSGEEPHFTGNERFIWGSVKQTIDLTRETSEKRKTTGSMGGTAAAENREIANSSKPQQNIANGSKPAQPAANDSSKEKKRNEKKDLLDDDDDLSRAEKRRTLLNKHEQSVFRAFQDFAGRIPHPEEVYQIATAAILKHFTPDMAAEAVRIAAGNGAMSIPAYAKELLQDWDAEYIRTPEELGMHQYLYDMHDSEGIEKARKHRKEAHERGETA